jgi:murein DD-endopeptidase MepM/ murein hydrolase activator NlpD
MDGRSWSALRETCYYAIDLLRSPRVVTMARHSASGVNRSKVSIVPISFPDEAITLGDIPQAAPSPADLRRDAREQAKVARLWQRPDRPAQFTLPLGAPASPLPAAQGFGSRNIFNGNTKTSEIHNGADYALPAGTRVAAAADGRVVLAEELFFAGNAVFIDHGDGLITMYFHLSNIVVKAGQDVRKGEAIGAVGETGRVTGPHLHFGVRWHGARINPALLLEDPARIPAIAP